MKIISLITMVVLSTAAQQAIASDLLVAVYHTSLPFSQQEITELFGLIQSFGQQGKLMGYGITHNGFIGNNDDDTKFCVKFSDLPNESELDNFLNALKNLPVEQHGTSLTIEKTICTVSVSQIKTRFLYDESTGKCINGEGQEGKNEITVAELAVTKNGECSILPEHPFQPQVEGAGYTEVSGLNLRGADLQRSSLTGFILTESDFRGANMNTNRVIYSSIEGAIDQYTTLPKHMRNRDHTHGETACAPINNHVDCLNL